MTPRPALILLVDACSADYFHERKNNAVNRLATEGECVDLAHMPFYPGCDDFVFGAPPAVHGNWLNYQYADRFPFGKNPASSNILYDAIDASIPQRATGRPFRAGLYRLLGGAPPFHPQFLPRTLWPSLRAAGPRSDLPTLFSSLEQAGARVRWYSRDSPFERGKRWGGAIYRKLTQQRLLRWFMDSMDQADVVYGEISTLLDRVGHRHGPHGPAMDRAVDALSRQVDHVYRYFRNRHPNGIFMLLSDHGMSPVSHAVDPMDVLRQAGLTWGRDHVAILHGTCAHLQCRDDAALATAARAWRETGHPVVDNADLAAADYPAALGPGELLLAVNEGTVVRPNHFTGATPQRGMHGYWRAQQTVGRPMLLLHGLGPLRLRSGTPMRDLHGLIKSLVLA